MTWAEYYERYDGWQESTQYSRLASIANFGPDGSPSEEISDCIQYEDTRTATSILRRVLAAGVRFQTSEVVEIVDSGQVEDGYRYGRWYYGHGHTEDCEFCRSGGCNGKCNSD